MNNSQYNATTKKSGHRVYFEPKDLVIDHHLNKIAGLDSSKNYVEPQNQLPPNFKQSGFAPSKQQDIRVKSKLN